jgi:glucose/arabinose dehydrogenase
MSVTTGIGGSVTIPVRGETSDNIWYRFYLAATDTEGAADTVFRDIQPRKATVQFMTEPAGLELTLDGQPRVAPFQIVGVVGMERDFNAPGPQSIGGQTWEFESWSHGGAAAGTITWPAQAVTYTATFTAVQTENQPPAVSLTAPAAGAQITVQTSTTLSATASDADGSVAHVTFFADGNEIGTDATSPYSVAWTPTVAGTVALTARATDNDGAQTTSAAVTVTVVPVTGGDQTPPTIVLTAPADLALNLTGALTMTADAADNVGVAGVQFQVDGQNVGAEDTTAPYSVTLPATSAYARGMHVVRARARDAAGNVSAWSSATVTFGGTQSLSAGFTAAQFGADMPDLATTLSFAPDGRLFVALKQGAIRIVKDGTLLAQNFASFGVDDSGERGLIGLAFHPQFATNGYVYVHYSTTSGAQRISRVTANGDVMVPGSEVHILNLPASGSIFHNGGAIRFGPDGRLYVALGDDATSANAQSLTTVFGKILRLNDDGSIPTDNPFYSTASGLNRSIWALGLRNPYTFAFQPGTGRMLINDVGDGSWEEINEGGAGRNFGWPATEGPTTNPTYTAPLFAYRHHDDLLTGASIVGASFYNPATHTFPASYAGNYFFADYVSRWVYRLDPANGHAAYAFAWLPNSITDLTVSPDGALYVVTAPSFTSSRIVRIGYSP